VLAEARDRLTHAVECADVADGAEQADDCVVSSREVEVAHVADTEVPGGILSPRDLHERRIEVDAIDAIAVSFGEQPRVLAGSARDIEDGLHSGSRGLESRRDLRRLGFVILEAAVDQVVELCGFAEHGTKRLVAVLQGGSTRVPRRAHK